MGFAILERIGQTIRTSTCSKYRFDYDFFNGTVLERSLGFSMLHAKWVSGDDTIQVA